MPRLLMRILLLLAVAFGTPLQAQVFERFGIREGLPSEVVNDVALGPDGLLWVATDGGLARYDGHGFTVWSHHPDDLSTLPSSRIFAVAPAAGEVWVGTVEGLARLDLRTGASHHIGAMPTSRVEDIVADADGTLWVGYRGAGLWRYRPARDEATLVPFARDGVPYRGRIISLAAHDGAVWAALGTASDQSAVVCRVDPVRLACADTHLGEDWRLLEDAGQAVLLHTDPDTGSSHLDWLNAGERWVLSPSVNAEEAFRSILRTSPDQ
ncbi:MAG: two-component regulator propeller domain-containing protein, partial [Bacteroidota bacterium]